MKSLCLLIALPALLYVFRRMSLRGRREMSDQDVARLFNLGSEGLSALKFVSQIYSIPTGYLRPGDSFVKKGFLTIYDSWMFNSGYNMLEDLFGDMEESFDPEWTIMDFARWYARLSPAQKALATAIANNASPGMDAQH